MNVNKIAKKMCDDIEQTYKNFLMARYGFVPKECELVTFYKDNKITVKHVIRLDEHTITVREKGHKVFVMRSWTEVDENRFNICFKVEKAVLPRKAKEFKE